MGITYQKEEKLFHLQAKNTSYIIKISETEDLYHVYWGKKLNLIEKTDCTALNPYLGSQDRASFTMDLASKEYPSYGHSDFRQPAYQVQLKNGSRISNLKYKSHEIYRGKKSLDGLPATYVEDDSEAETLEVTLVDEVANLRVILSYTTYEDFAVITRSVKFINQGSKELNLKRALSASIDFKNSDYELLQLSGAWTRERHIKRRSLVSGLQAVESKRGASSHSQNPFIALLREDTTEGQGEAYGFSFVYSGNFLAQVEVNKYDQTRVAMGINPFDFNWLLEPKQSFQAPEVVLVYSDQGINKMSQTYHKLYRTRLARGKFRDKERPILINNWEATYFDFNEDKILEIAEVGQELGLELFVLDDGWFGKRDDDTSSLGDWFADENKLPNGLDSLGEQINDLGLEFGLWFEPEMVSPDSDLYRAHPDWCLHVPNRERSMARDQLILDLSRPEVCDYIIEQISDILESAPITYVKWDMNRNMTEIGSAKLSSQRQQETVHRYMLGLYKVLEELTTRFPNILFESCSGGGGRFDPGMLHYMPQTWTSDDTDAVERLKIQYGTSIVYPLSAMGAHVSAVPNHQVARITPLKTRGNVAEFGNLGYELDLTKLTTEEKEIIKEQVSEYKEVRKLVQQGNFYRLATPFAENNDTAWMIVSEDRKEAYVGYYKVLAEPNVPCLSLKLQGLNPKFKYRMLSNEKIYRGDLLMYAGVNLPQELLTSGDFQSVTWRLKAIE
ncbi:alpha-galactosidase [Halobacteroides halobius DSM 5150]|uniref:Alpha-galactosidase n=1 Tax=Halobacteroides halobius (strain ATCC 35273 / DSM 5150 / MD-1) TaxID=748449 RepID=L0KAS5_HALHC|nr:alpha-galactosidase [Halobacteroides halobius]AGB42387.1 alpha-galactosidase [Halobacteroides halobius DSM 5150]